MACSIDDAPFAGGNLGPLGNIQQTEHCGFYNVTVLNQVQLILASLGLKFNVEWGASRCRLKVQNLVL
jgi:hypothetical protein